MSISLQKGQKVDLTKGNAGLSKLLVGLGWDPVKAAGGGGLFGLGKTKTANVDCDASVFMLEEGDRLTNKQDLIYFGNLKSACQSVQHSGDNTTGAGDGDDEQVMVDLSKIPSRIQKLIFVVNIYDCKNRKQDFGMIQNAFIRVADASKNSELMKFNLTDNYAGKTSLLVGEIYRHNGEWKFSALGEGTSDDSLGTLSKRYTDSFKK